MGHVCTWKMQVIHPSNERQYDPGKEHGAPFPKVFFFMANKSFWNYAYLTLEDLQGTLAY